MWGKIFPYVNMGMDEKPVSLLPPLKHTSRMAMQQNIQPSCPTVPQSHLGSKDFNPPVAQQTALHKNTV